MQACIEFSLFRGNVCLSNCKKHRNVRHIELLLCDLIFMDRKLGIVIVWLSICPHVQCT